MAQEQTSELVTIKIDGREVSVPKGTFVLTAARKAGIHIPTFCEYPDLRPYGACRMCTVEIVTRRGSTTDISCSTPVSEGMEVYTRSQKVREAQRFVVEALLVDHPLECPVCDKSGECDLQNNAYLSEVRVDNPLRRPKQSWELEMLSESVSIKRDRCVLCGRCVRVCDELVGSTALAWARRGFTSYIDAAFGEDLKASPCVSCGLCIEVCPVGALLNTSYHDTARAWFLKHVDTVCTYCGVGCSLQLHVESESGRVKRVIGKRDTGFNGEQLCARGFFGFEFLEQPERLTTPMIRRNGGLVETSWDEALSYVAERLASYAGESFAGVAGAHCTNEENYLFGKFVRGVMRSNNLDFDAGSGHGVRASGLRDSFGYDAATNSFEDILSDAGAVLVLGTNLSATHPVLSYKLQTAVRRRGIKLIVASPRPVPLSQVAHLNLEYRPGTEAILLTGLAAIAARRGMIANTFFGERAEGYEEWTRAAEAYTTSEVSARTGVPEEILERAAVLYATGGQGEGAEREDGLFRPSAILYSHALTLQEGGERGDHAAANLALLTGNVGRRGAGVNPLKTASNGQGALDMGCAPFLLPGQRPLADEAARSALEAGWGLAEPIPAEPGLGLEDTFGAALSGRLKAMYVMGANPARSARDREHARRALEALELLVVQDVFLTETAQLADVVLPACSWAEKEGSLTSAERRIQRVNRALAPAGQSRPDWEILVALLEHMGYEGLYNDSDEILTEIARTVPGYEGVTSARLERSGTVVSERPGKVYRAPSPDEIARIGVHWPAGRDGTGTPVLYTESFPRGRAAFIPVPLEEAELGEEVYRDSIEASLYVQGTDTMTGRCPTLASLQRNGAADSSPERGRGVGIVKGPNLSLAAYSTGQLTDI